MEFLKEVGLEPNRPRDGIVDASLVVFAVPPKRLLVGLAFGL